MDGLWGGIGTLAHSFFVGTPGSGWPAWFYGPGGNNASFSIAGGYNGNSNNATIVYMAPATEAICYFSKIQGEFNGSGEYADIVNFLGTWVLVTGHSSGTGVYASANCFRYAQWTL